MKYADMVSDEDHYYVPKNHTDYVLWNRVNVPPVRDRRLLRSCPRWPRPGQRVVGCVQDVDGLGLLV
jgi:hypothetical protein